jgi:DNA-binding NarL/FixJ family response regulator
MEEQNQLWISSYYTNSKNVKDKIKIALVDDELLFLKGLTLLFASENKIEVVLSSSGGIEFLDTLSKLSLQDFPSVALLDIQMEPMDGFELVEKLKKEYPNLNIIILSSHYKSAMFGHMIRLGVSAFLPKYANQGLLVEAIEKVHRTGVFFTQKDREMLTTFVRSKTQKRFFNSEDKLTSREKQVLMLICKERTNHEIAEKLYLSKRTVESHRQRILEKTGAKNTAGLVIYAISHDIYSPDSKYYY